MEISRSIALVKRQVIGKKKVTAPARIVINDLQVMIGRVKCDPSVL